MVAIVGVNGLGADAHGDADGLVGRVGVSVFGDDLFSVGIAVFAFWNSIAGEEIFVNYNFYARKIMGINRKFHFNFTGVFFRWGGESDAGFNALTVGVEKDTVVGFVVEVAVKGIFFVHEETIIADDVVDGLAVFGSENVVAVGVIGRHGFYFGDFDGDSLFVFVKFGFVDGEEATIAVFGFATIKTFVNDEAAALKRDGV